MKVIIAGSRGLSPTGLDIDAALRAAGWIDRVSEAVSGHAQGVDRCGEAWAYSRQIACKMYPANWRAFGRSAGHRRNREMGDYADALLAFWDGESRGTQGMIDYMRSLAKPVHVVTVRSTKETA